MSDILVVSFSRAGTTHTAARFLAGKLEADHDEVAVRAGYEGPGGFIRGVIQSIQRARPSVSYQKDPADYALVLIAAPVWAGRIAAPMRTYLSRNHGRIKRAAALCLSGSGGAYHGVFREIGELTGCTPEPALALAQRDVVGGTYKISLQQFAADVRAALARPAGREAA